MRLLNAALRRITRWHLVAVSATLLAIGSYSPVQAEYEWIGGTTTGNPNPNNGNVPDLNWDNPANWLRTAGEDPSSVPSTGAQTRVGNGNAPPNSDSLAIIDSTTPAASTGNFFISDAASNRGTLNMSGSSLTASGFFSVGGNGGNSGGNGTLLLTGGNISVPTGNFFVGNSSVVDLTTNGNLLMSGSAGTVSAGLEADIGIRANGTLNVGAGTFTMNANRLFIGRTDGSGTFIVSGGQALLGSSSITMANTAAARAYLSVSAGTLAGVSSINFASASGGMGTMVMSGTGVANIGSLSIAGTTGGIGWLQIDGGTLTTTGNIEVTRNASTATMVMTNGRLNTPNLLFAINSNVVGGTVDIRGGQVLIGTNINVSNNSSTPSGRGTLLLSQADVNVPTELVIGGRITQSGGTANVAFNGGTLTVQTIGFNTQIADPFNAGTLSPGNTNFIGGGASFGTTNFATLSPVGTNFANFNEKSNYHLHIDVGDGGAKDLVTLGNGTATLGGWIDVDYRGSTPTVGAIYDILIAGTANAITDASNLVSHTPGIEFTKSLVTTTFTNDTLRLTISAVPEPGSLGFVGIGALGLLRRRTRRSSTRRKGIPRCVT